MRSKTDQTSTASSAYRGCLRYGQLSYSLDGVRLIAEALALTLPPSLLNMGIAHSRTAELFGRQCGLCRREREAELIGIERSLPMDLKLTLSLQ
jgi:hypothetical protein